MNLDLLQGVDLGVYSESIIYPQEIGQGVGNEGYIRKLIHALSLVRRLQSYIVTCEYI